MPGPVGPDGFGDPPPEPEADGYAASKKEKAEEPAAEEDVRTLSVTWDEHGDRYKL